MESGPWLKDQRLEKPKIKLTAPSLENHTSSGIYEPRKQCRPDLAAPLGL